MGCAGEQGRSAAGSAWVQGERELETGGVVHVVVAAAAAAEFETTENEFDGVAECGADADVRVDERGGVDLDAEQEPTNYRRMDVSWAKWVAMGIGN